ncbi:spondin-1 isoform X3 [Aphidius gifuensis]|uniref:spondin-1 isoform X3 n=1 Tax=Aphidius gifuensis TaxID=684658 RepID=UPI001CDD6024|nr:spondin-1 isoform X3 [Aphidius gifuensis]
MAYHVRLFISILLLIFIIDKTNCAKCDRRLEGVTTSPISLEGRFAINMWALNQTEIVEQYMPNVAYTVTINGYNVTNIQGKFTRFILTADNKNESSNVEGKFDIIDENLTKYSDKCPNTVVESTKISKEKISVTWTSPPEGSGCIMIRATIMETPETWYMDEAGISKVYCQDPKADADEPGPVLQDCCACDEAKYEVTFEGIWSRNTHPKNFPPKGWLTRFSDVIGASHTVDYRFWRYNETASQGLQQVAEFGSTRKLESELKDQSEHIRTIIKARGITHPNVTSKTFAVFRVDKQHHLMSLVSMIVPSPDWIVGVSGLELCLPNCSWIEHKELNMYPIDVGTDDGITYMSPDALSDPPQLIRRITNDWPNDSQSPFFDPLGPDMKPMAKLHLNRQRLYEKSCGDTTTSSQDSEACRTTRWGEWGPCGVTCGRGTRLRQRNYKDKEAAALHNCNVPLTDRGDCYANNPNCNGQTEEGTILSTPECELSEWSTWSSCTTTCGEGSTTRSRNFIHKKHRKKCKAIANGPQLQETFDCDNGPCENSETKEETNDENNAEDDDDGDDDDSENKNNEENENPDVTEEWLQNCPADAYGPWSQWSPCSVSCGSGLKSRYRFSNDNTQGINECKEQHVNCMAEVHDCNITPEIADEMCSESLMPGNCQRIYKRVYFDNEKQRCQYFDYTGCDGNKNNFDTMEACKKICIDMRKNIKIRHNVQQKNHKVTMSSLLNYHIPAQSERRSGKSKRAKYENQDTEDFNGIQTGSQVVSTTRVTNDDKKIDCQVTEWSDWAPCKICKNHTYKTRAILVKAKNGGNKCPTKLAKKMKCHRRPECADHSHSRRRRYRDRRPEWDHNQVSADCKLTQWSTWSKCDGPCGNSLRHRTKKIIVDTHGPTEKPCTDLVEFQKCSITCS